MPIVTTWMFLDTQTRVIRYPNTRLRISKHVYLIVNFQKNTVFEQMFVNFHDYSNHSLQLTLTFTLQFKNIPEFNLFKIPRTLLSHSKSSLLILVASVTLLDVQGPSSFDTLTLCSAQVSYRLTRHLNYVRSFLERVFTSTPELNNFVAQAILKE